MDKLIFIMREFEVDIKGLGVRVKEILWKYFELEFWGIWIFGW